MKKSANKRWLKIFLRALLYLCLVLGIVVAGVVLSLQTRPVRDEVKRIIEETVTQNTRAVCRIGELNGNLISRFEIKGLELKDSKTGMTLMLADMVDAVYSIPMLLGRVLWINRMALDGVSVNLLEAEDGTWNFDMLAPDNPPKHQPKHQPEPMPDNSSERGVFPGLKLNINQLAISDSDITISQQADSGEFTQHFKRLNCQARLNIEKDISAKFKHLTVFLDNPRIDLKDLSGAIRYNFFESRVDFIDTRIKGRKSDFTINGRLSFLDQDPNEINLNEINPDEVNPDEINLDLIDMNLRADVKAMSLGEFGRAFPIQMPDEDVVSGNLSVTGTVSEMDCQVDLRMDICHVVSQGLVTIDESNDVGLDIAGKISGLDLSALPVLDLESFSGNMNTDFSLVWEQIGMPDQTGQINLDLMSSVLWDYVIDEAKLDVRISGDDFIFETLRLKTPYGKLDGDLDLAGILSSEKDNQIQFNTDIEAFNPEIFLKNHQYAGSINGTVCSMIFIPKTFALEGLAADTTCRVNASRMKNMDIVSAELETSWQDETITINCFDIETSLGTAALKGSASIKNETCRFNTDATLFDLNLISAFFPDIAHDTEMGGSASVMVDFNGKWREPVVSAVLNAERLTFNKVSADSLSAEGYWKGNIKEFNASAKCVGENIQTNGLQIPLFDLKTTLTPASIQADIELQGRPKELFTLSGNISHWLEPVKEVLIDRLTLVSFGQPPLVNREPVKMSISKDRILVDSLHLESGNASLILKADAGLNPPAGILADLSLRDLNLNRISAFWKEGKHFKGSLSSEVQLSGVLDNPVIKMTASVKDASYNEFPVTNMLFDLKYADSQVEVSGSGFTQGRKFLEVNGSASNSLVLYPFSFTPRPDNLFVDLSLEPIDISDIKGLMPSADQFQGTLSSHVTLSGLLEKPKIHINLSRKTVYLINL